MRRRRALVLMAALVAGALAVGTIADAARRKRRARPPAPITLDAAAESYVKLALAMGQHDADYVDAYYGPPAWRTAADAAKKPLATIGSEAQSLVTRLERHPPTTDEEMVRLRHVYLIRQLSALNARTRMVGGTRFSFDEESRALYDAVAPAKPDSEFAVVLSRLESLLPGEGPLVERYEAFRREFIIPPARLDTVFKTAIRECRTRTLRHVALPPTESFTVEYVTGKSWGGYNWYHGGYRSVIQVNTDLPSHIDRAIDLAAHEGYPGHHVYNALLEKHLMKDRGWVEFAVLPLFSSQSLIGEGTANFGIEVAFPGREKLEYERTVLYPLAGIDPRKAERYDEVQSLMKLLSHAGNQAARRYLDKRVERQATIDWLGRYALQSPERAERSVKFMEQYRSYVINYNLGQDMVRRHIEARGGTADHPDVRWREFVALLTSPRLPSGLQ